MIGSTLAYARLESSFTCEVMMQRGQSRHYRLRASLRSPSVDVFRIYKCGRISGGRGCPTDRGEWRERGNDHLRRKTRLARGARGCPTNGQAEDASQLRGQSDGLEAGLQKRHFDLNAFAQQFRPGGVRSFEAVPDDLAGDGMAKVQPPRLTAQEFGCHWCSENGGGKFLAEIATPWSGHTKFENQGTRRWWHVDQPDGSAQSKSLIQSHFQEFESGCGGRI